MDITLLSVILLVFTEIYTCYAGSLLEIQILVTSTKNYALSALGVRQMNGVSNLDCYAECMQNEECIAVNVYRPAEGDYECHLLADAATTEADLQEDTDALYMGPAFSSMIECPPPPVRNLFVDSHVDVSNRQYVRFYLKGIADGNLAISTQPLCTGNCYYTLIGGWSNQRTYIGEYVEHVSVDDTILTPNILSAIKYQLFWMSWDVTASSLTVMFGRGLVIKENVIHTRAFSDPPSEIRYLSVTTFKGKEATFLFVK